jgi:hypothetical protein
VEYAYTMLHGAAATQYPVFMPVPPTHA